MGLIVSLAFLIIIGSYAAEQWEVARQNPDYRDIYVLGLPDYFGLTWGWTPAAKDRIHEIETIARYSPEASSAFWEWEGGVVNIRIEDLDRTLFQNTDFIVSEDNPLNSYNIDTPFDHYGNTVPFVKLRKGSDSDEFYAKVESVCKVFGGTAEGETLRGVKEYMPMALVASVIGVSVAVGLAGRYLEQFIVKLEGYGWMFALAVVIVLVLAVVSVYSQIRRSALTSPASALKKE